MTGKIYHSLFLSIFIHCLFILFILFGLRNSIQDFKNLTYITLIQEAGSLSDTAIFQNKNELKAAETEKQKKEISKTAEKNHKISSLDEKLLQERLAALEAKKKILEKARTGSLVATGQKNNMAGVSQNYLTVISGLIRQNWNIPDTIPKNLEAIVSVRILYDGQIIIEGFEKNSGNALFDSSVIKAIRNSSPLPPPKNEVRVGLRFRP